MTPAAAGCPPQGRVELERYRGRAAYSFPVQAAEQAIRESEGLARDRRPRAHPLPLRGRRRLARPLPRAGGGRLRGRRRRRARGRAGLPHVRRAEPRRPSAMPRRAARLLIRRKPSRTSRRTSTRRPASSRSPGSSERRNGSSASKHATSSSRACAGKRSSLPSKTSASLRVVVLEVGDHRAPPLEPASRYRAVRARGAGRARPQDRPPRIEEPAASAPGDLLRIELGTQLLGELGRLEPRRDRRRAGRRPPPRGGRAPPAPRRATCRR